MFTRAERVAAAACTVIVACTALAHCGGGMRSPTEPAVVTPTRTPTATSLPTPSPTSTPTSPTPTPGPTNGSVFGYVSDASADTQDYLPNVILRLHQEGMPDQVESSGTGSLSGYYAFHGLRSGSAVITATLAAYSPFKATITVGQTPLRYDIPMRLADPEGGGLTPTTTPQIPSE